MKTEGSNGGNKSKNDNNKKGSNTNSSAKSGNKKNSLPTSLFRGNAQPKPKLQEFGSVTIAKPPANTALTHAQQPGLLPTPFVTPVTQSDTLMTQTGTLKTQTVTPMTRATQPAAPKVNNGVVTVGSLDLTKQAAAIAPLFVAFAGRPHLEIEARLGKFQHSQFQSGVTKADFSRIHDMLMTYGGWVNNDQVNKWVSSFDYMLDNNVRVTKNSSGNTFIKKTVIDHVTFACPERSYDIRISLKEELPTQVSLPQDPRMVRVKKRKSFIYKNRWRFDLTIVWSGKDEQDAQSRQPNHEIECEFIAPCNTAGPNYDYTALSLLEKMIDFLGRDDGPLTLTRI